MYQTRDNPCRIFVAPNNEVYYVENYKHAIRKVLQNGNIVTIAGNGTAGFSGDNGPATKAQLNNPADVFVASNNEVYLCDTGNHRIRKILLDGNIITIAGNGIEGFSGDNGPAIDAQLHYPTSVFVSNNEVYIVDRCNHRIRKILQDGSITTIAGCGYEGFSGDNDLATKSRLNFPTSLFVLNNEIYIVDTGNNRIRKLLQNGIIVTIAGDGNYGFGSDNIPAIYSQLSQPTGIFVTLHNEVFIADSLSHRIRKVLQNGNIVTIAGNGTPGFSGDNGSAANAQLFFPMGVYVLNDEIYITDFSNSRIRKVLQNGTIITITGNNGNSAYDFAIYPQMRFYSKTLRILKKNSRDELFGLEIYGFMPLIERLSPQFSQILKNEKIISSMNRTQHVIIQKLIDSLIYDYSQLNFTKNEVLDVLFILGLFKNDEFIDLKRSLIYDYVNSLTMEEVIWEKIESMIKICTEEFRLHNYILEQLNNYFIESAVFLLRTVEGNASLLKLPIISRNAMHIISKMVLYQPNPIMIEENIEVQPQNLESLFNDKKTSDVKIKMGEDKYLYCHKTVLSSNSTFFAALFESGSSFSDFMDGIFTPEESEDLELLEIIIKYCYGISSFTKIDSGKIVNLLDMAMKHEIEYLIDYCNSILNSSCQSN